MINFKKLLAGTLSAAMVLGTTFIPAFAEGENSVAKVGDEYFSSIDDAVTKAQSSTTDKWHIEKITLLTNDILDISKGPDNYVSYNITQNDTVITGERLADDAHKDYYKLTNAATLYIPASVDSLILENVKNLCRIEIEEGADVTLKLNGNNEMAGNIIVPQGAKLTIEDVTSDSTGRLAVYNTTTKEYVERGMNAFGAGDGYSAAIGGTQTKNGGEIVIKSGEIEAYSNYGSAIGGGQQKSAKVIILDGRVTAESSYGCAIGGGQQSAGDVTISGGIIDAKSDRSAPIGGGNKVTTNSNIVITGGDITVARRFGTNMFGNSEGEAAGATITGGTFNTDVSAYAPKGYYTDGETVKKSEAKVIDNAKAMGVEVKLKNLDKNSAINHSEDATYQVVMGTASEADVAKANEAIKNQNDTNTSKQFFDISVVKVDSQGVKSEVDVRYQPVTLILSETPCKDTTVNVYHVNDSGNVETIENVAQNGNTVSFTAPSFSTYAVTYTTAAADPNTITSKVNVVFTKVDDTENQYYVTLKALDDNKNINRFMSADLAFLNESTGVDYEITPASNINANVVKEDGASREYHFEMNGSVASSVTGSEITLGTITFNGFGTVKLSVDKDYISEHSVNIVNTAKASDNIVDNYTVAAGTLVVNDVNNGVIDTEIKPETADLTVKVSFPNAVVNQAVDYQDMKVTVSGNGANEVVELGDDVTFDNDTYTVEFNDMLVKNNAYTVTVSGAGYRTARYTVSMTGNKTLNFWNNVKDTPMVIEEGSTGTGVNTNFLAGDIVKDGQINIYDLSAVVSYFGTDNLVTNHRTYAKYDLNRDGVIDSKDVAYVLVSWGK